MTEPSGRPGGPAVEVTDLVRTYHTKRGEVRALDGLDLEVRRGEVHGLLGPNGAALSGVVIGYFANVTRRTGRYELG